MRSFCLVHRMFRPWIFIRFLKSDKWNLRFLSLAVCALKTHIFTNKYTYFPHRIRTVLFCLFFSGFFFSSKKLPEIYQKIWVFSQLSTTGEKSNYRFTGKKKSYNFIALKIIFFQCTLDGYVHVTETIFGMENTCIRLESNKISVSIINKK